MATCSTVEPCARPCATPARRGRPPGGRVLGGGVLAGRPGHVPRERRGHGQRARGGRGGAPEARVLFASTAEVYGNAARIPTPEDEPPRPISPYAASKAAAELACAALGARRRRRARPQPGGPGPRRALRRRVVDAAAGPPGGRGRRHACSSATSRPSATSSTCVTSAAPTGCCSTARFRPAPTTSARAARSRWRTCVELLVGLARVPVQVERDEARVRPAEIPRLCRRPDEAAGRDRLASLRSRSSRRSRTRSKRRARAAGWSPGA